MHRNAPVSSFSQPGKPGAPEVRSVCGERRSSFGRGGEGRSSFGRIREGRRVMVIVAAEAVFADIFLLLGV